jgi:ribosomal protein S11
MATKSNKTNKTVTFKSTKGNIKFTPAKGKTANRKAAKRSTSYETVVSNIQKITYASGTVSYRVRVAGESQFATSLKKAREVKKAMLA